MGFKVRGQKPVRRWSLHSFFWQSRGHLPKNYKHRLYVQKSCEKHFCTKMLLIKCWWLQIYLYALWGQKPVRSWSFRSKSFCSFFLTKQIYLYTLSEVHFADKGKKRKKSNNTTLFLFGPFLVDEIIWGSIFFCAQKNVKILFFPQEGFNFICQRSFGKPLSLGNLSFCPSFFDLHKSKKPAELNKERHTE